MVNKEKLKAVLYRTATQANENLFNAVKDILTKAAEAGEYECKINFIKDLNLRDDSHKCHDIIKALVAEELGVETTDEFGNYNSLFPTHIRVTWKENF